jgi:hypothetical protein
MPRSYWQDDRAMTPNSEMTPGVPRGTAVGHFQVLSTFRIQAVPVGTVCWNLLVLQAIALVEVVGMARSRGR